jgi:hypothetical protein
LLPRLNQQHISPRKPISFTPLPSDEIVASIWPNDKPHHQSEWSDPISKKKKKHAVSHVKNEAPSLHAPSSKPKVFDINKYHTLLGHINEQYLVRTAKYYNQVLTGTLSSCIPCALAKSTRTPISKTPNVRDPTPGRRIYLDISYVNKLSTKGNKYWLLLVDDSTDFAWSYFLGRKSDTASTVVQFLTTMKNQNTPVFIIRCDNSGENQVLRTATQNAGFSIQYEYTAPSTPQHNGRVERKFSVLYNLMRSMLNYASIPDTICTALWAEAASHSTDLINAICTASNPVPPYKNMFLVPMHRTFTLCIHLAKCVFCIIQLKSNQKS